MNALIFFVSMTVEQLFDLQHAIRNGRKTDNITSGDDHNAKKRSQKKTIRIDKMAHCGLYDSWSGAGSVLEIELEQDVVLPIQFISTAWPDGARGYGASEVYGLASNYWTSTLREAA